ncbi:MAG TPA: N-acetylmuramoyl-L-alanine amidase [Herpetosiphonaceae bacterium]|nr:N-acetylmuramoyl-L-alanine amidase [Herpetosiphonaceae bacterium]
MDYPIIPYPSLPHAFESMPPGRRIDMIVMHSTAGYKQSDLYTLSGRDRRHLVSTHYYVTKVGEIYQLVQDKDVAWHAGVSYWQGETSCNRFSLGVELENRNDGVDKYPQNQLNAALWLVRMKVRQYRIPRSRLVRHADIAPGRKSDPRAFPWESFKANVFRDLPDEPPPPPVPQQIPEVQLRDTLIDQSYSRVNHVYHPDLSLHQFALKQRLGPPVAPPFRFTAENRIWQAEIYGSDVICSPSGEWQDIRRLSELEESELKSALRTEAYRQLGVQYHPDWTMHQFADRNDLGVPLTESFPLSLQDGRSFSVQIFQLDTLFSPAGKWNVVLPLSTLLDTPQLSTADAELRDLLINQQYVRIGNRYHPDWELHKAALQMRVGAALSDQERLTVGRQDYMVASYARDVLFTPTGDWKLIKRLSDLL